ncbi:MAG: ribosome recycling factor [Candidatus Latescibacteria bacterium]|nr:ribosome recycling factor [Candidatus Latescibacterota bacterium]
MVDEVLSETKSAMQKAVEAFGHEISMVRSGRANASLLDAIRVEYYGSQMPINQVANIGAPEPRLITIQPWDKTALPAIEKAIMASSLGLVPSNDGTIIRLPIPQLTEERREELVRIVRQMAEEGRVSVRNARRDANEMLKDGQKEGEIPEDESKRGQDQVQELTDEYVKKVDDLLKEKEEEIMEV